MKFLREATAKGLQILPAELVMAGFPETETMEVRVAEDATAKGLGRAILPWKPGMGQTDPNPK